MTDGVCVLTETWYGSEECDRRELSENLVEISRKANKQLSINIVSLAREMGGSSSAPPLPANRSFKNGHNVVINTASCLVS
jgi:hypothetical protein